jgi:TRAP-type C4-dicarboxylate transport system substrate-binding protein
MTTPTPTRATSRRRFLAGAAGIIAAPAVLREGYAQAPQATLRLHHFLPPASTFHTQVAQPWAQQLATASGGRIKVDLFPAMQLGGAPPALFDQARDGVVDIIWTLPGNTPGRFPIIETFELPFLPGTATANSQALAEFAAKHLANEFREVHPICFWAHDPGLIHTTAKQVTRQEDLGGLKLRFPTRLAGEALRALGASTVGMPIPQVPEALQRGTIDGTVLPWEVVPSIRVHELCKFHTEIPGTPGFYSTTFVMVMNKRRYEGLPADLRQVIDQNSGARLSKLAGEAWDRFSVVGRDAARGRGNSFHTLSAEEIARWRRATEPVVEGWVKTMNERGMKGGDLLAEARQLIAKYA